MEREGGQKQTKSRQKNIKVRHKTQRKVAGENDNTVKKKSKATVSLLPPGIQAFGDEFWYVVMLNPQILRDVLLI